MQRPIRRERESWRVEIMKIGIRAQMRSVNASKPVSGEGKIC